MAENVCEIGEGLLGVECLLRRQLPREGQLFQLLRWNDLVDPLATVVLVEDNFVGVVSDLIMPVGHLVEVLDCESLELVKRVPADQDQVHEVAGVVAVVVGLQIWKNVRDVEGFSIASREPIEYGPGH